VITIGILYSDGKSLSSKRETFNVYRIDEVFVKLGAKGVVGKDFDGKSGRLLMMKKK